MAPSAPAVAPRPLDKGKGAAGSSSAQGGTRGRRKKGDTNCATSTVHLSRTPPRSVRGLLVGPRRPALRPKARRGALVLRHHHYRVRRHHNHHHRWVHRRHHHLGVISPRGTSNCNNDNNSNSSNNSGRPTFRVAGKSRAPSECNPFSPLVYLPCRRVLTHLSAFRDRGVPEPTSECAACPSPDGSSAWASAKGGERGGRRRA
jgi:hypothetical protein